MFLTQQDFIGLYNLTQNSLDTEDFQSIINDVEKEVLIDAFGAGEYLKLVKYVERAEGEPENPVYENLINGAEFTISNNNIEDMEVRWDGLKNMLLGFCFSEIVKWQRSINTGAGESRIMNPNSAKSAHTGEDKRIKAFNDSMDLYGFKTEEDSLNRYTVKSLSLYPEFLSNFGTHKKKYRRTGLSKSIAPSLYNYLKANESDFPKWVFTDREKINIFGI